MKIAMMNRWNIPCGVSLHAELVGREWAHMDQEVLMVDFSCQHNQKIVIELI